METIPLPRLGFLRGVFLATHVASTDNQNNQKTEHIKGALITSKTHSKTYTQRQDSDSLV